MGGIETLVTHFILNGIACIHGYILQPVLASDAVNDNFRRDK